MLILGSLGRSWRSVVHQAALVVAEADWRWLWWRILAADLAEVEIELYHNKSPTHVNHKTKYALIF
jgi:hypothetical protein